MSIQSGKYTFYYMSRENLCFLCLTEESYPKRMAFLYLEDVADLILHELVREFGNQVCMVCVCFELAGCFADKIRNPFAVADTSRPRCQTVSIH
jgi:Regulated-SNARE-like domain